MKKFESVILEDIRRFSMLEKGDKVLVALSGGPDSVCLAVVLSRLREKLGISLAAGHVNYGLRGADSDKDESFCRDLCAKLGIPFHSTCADPLGGNAGNLEETARLQRYEFLSRIAAREKLIIATGHNSDDQSETFLLNLFRGAGYKGLSGMIPVREHRNERGEACMVIRPLLHVSRERILSYLKKKGQDFRIDGSNADLKFDRNWIRHELLPLLDSRFNSRPGERIAMAAELIGEAAQFLEKQAASKLERMADVSERGSLRVPVKELACLDTVLQREILRLALGMVRGNLTDLTSRHIFAVMELLEGQSGKKADLPGRIEVRKEFEFLVFGLQEESTPFFEYSLEVPGCVLVPEAGKLVKIEFMEEPVSGKGHEGSPAFQVTIRNRRPGDRLKISSERPRQSFSNLCTKNRIPLSERERTLIIEFPDGSHWVEGIGMPGKVCTADKTELIISVEPRPE